MSRPMDAARPGLSRRALFALGGGALALPLSLPLARAARAQDRPVVVGSKLDTEGALLGEMMAQLLEAKGSAVQRRLQLGPTRIVRQALLAGEIDLYPEYTGNGAFFFQMEDDPAWRDPAQAAAKVRALDAERNRLVWLEPAAANNTWAIAVRRDLARQANLRTLEDLARHLQADGSFKLAASAEFVESPAALPAFQKAYGFTLPPARLLVLSGGDTAVTMRAAAERLNGVNAAMVYGTDGAIQALDLVVLEDPKGAQMVYQPAPVVRQAVAERLPQLAEWMRPLFASLSRETLQRLNQRIVVDGQPARQVAEAHLRGLGLAR
ncbi:glycine betaine ABC transporter substrate-binding protein OsmF [Teichococcus cervicalis]|uniref:ABC transporter, substrate-binding protein, QAT family n=1 Tax=Pseudoroseomonas cervicalis ATCC 49957 TaxID=525371 RepID=D5RUI6_9PROT|nr:ABC transporter substrate-binding protein [Pseudoroseomonas cervicalis]EFH09032.1 ABC transporter, substrate-binding protein, QAT family [Pseudoroseomonas cervicalis ATCC 49957]